MAISRIWIEEGCIVSGSCQFVCPEVFELKEGDTAAIKVGVNIDEYEDLIREAAIVCPVSVIKYE